MKLTHGTDQLFLGCWHLSPDIAEDDAVNDSMGNEGDLREALPYEPLPLGDDTIMDIDHTFSSWEFHAQDIIFEFLNELWIFIVDIAPHSSFPETTVGVAKFLSDVVGYAVVLVQILSHEVRSLPPSREDAFNPLTYKELGVLDGHVHSLWRELTVRKPSAAILEVLFHFSVTDEEDGRHA